MSPWAWLLTGSVGVLAWTWAAYPTLMWVLGKLAPAPRLAPLVQPPRVTAILATRDDPSLTAARVADFLAADYPADRLDVVVGVDASSPERLEAVRALCAGPRVRVVASDAGGGKAAGLNAAVREATGEILVFSDAQQRFAPDAIAIMVTRLASDPRLGAVGGALQLPGDRPGAGGRSPVEWYWWMERHLRASEARVHSTVGVSGSIYTMWRRDWVPMPPQLILDDVWLPMRLVLAGRRVAYELTALAWDARSTSAAQEQVRKVRTLTGNFQLMAWLPALLVPFRNPVWAQFISHKVLRLSTPWMVLLAALSGAVLLALSVPRSVLIWIIAALVTLLAAAMIIPRLRSVTTRGVGWVWSLQVAVVQATMNGVRGRWDVWK